MKKYFLTGLILFLPVALTLFIIIFLFDFFTTPFIPPVALLIQNIQPHLPFVIPEEIHIAIARLLAFILLCIFIFLLGIVVRWFLIRHILYAADAVISRIPFMRTVFKTSRDIFSALFSQDGKKAFKRPVMVPFPELPNYCLAFVVGDVPQECQDRSKIPLTAVFAPTAPHPISGFIFFTSEENLHELDMTNEDALKFLISCGVIIPKK